MGIFDELFPEYFLIIIIIIVGYIFLSDKFACYNNICRERCSDDNVSDIEEVNDHFVAAPKFDDAYGSLDNTGGDFQGRKGGAGDFTAEVYMPPRLGITTTDDQDAFLSIGLTPASALIENHGYPIEGLMGGGYIPLPYSAIDGINTNEDMAINI